MIFYLKDYILELIDDKNYSPGSADNINRYSKEYIGDTIIKNNYRATNKIGLRLFDRSTDEELTSIILCESGGLSSLHSQSFIFDDEKLMICIGTMVYCIRLPDLAKIWCYSFDHACIFSIHNIENDFVVHGELSISRFDKNGALKWTYSSNDIFVNLEDNVNFAVLNGRIKVRDWYGEIHLLDGNGRRID